MISLTQLSQIFSLGSQAILIAGTSNGKVSKLVETAAAIAAGFSVANEADQQLAEKLSVIRQQLQVMVDENRDPTLAELEVLMARDIAVDADFERYYRLRSEAGVKLDPPTIAKSSDEVLL